MYFIFRDTRNLSRVLNSCVSDPHVNLEVVTDLNGNTPNNYSQSIDALRGMTGLYIINFQNY